MPDLTTSFTLCKVAGKKRAAIKAYHQVNGNSKDERRQFLEERAEYWALGNQPKKVKVLKNIKSKVATCVMYAKLKEIRGPLELALSNR